MACSSSSSVDPSRNGNLQLPLGTAQLNPSECGYCMFRFILIEGRKGTTVVLRPAAIIPAILSDVRSATVRNGSSMRCAYRSVVRT